MRSLTLRKSVFILVSNEQKFAMFGTVVIEEIGAAAVMGASHHVVVGMMGHAAQRGQVALTVRRRQPQGELGDAANILS